MANLNELLEAVKRYQAALLLVTEPYGWMAVKSTQNKLLEVASTYEEVSK